MKTHRKSGRKLFLISMFGFLLSSASVFLVILIPEGEKGLTQAGMATGILFWIGMFLGILFFVLSWKLIKNDEQYLKTKGDRKPGYISFGKTKGGLIADGLTLLFLVITILGNTAVHFPELVMVVSMFILIYSFYLRFLLNGRVYRYISNCQRVKEGERDER